MLKVLDVDGAVRRVRGGWEATGQDWRYDEERYRRVREAREREQQAMLDYLATDACRMRFLREQLDDPEAADCGRCDNCGGLALSGEVSTAAVAEASARLSRPGVVVEPRKMWPTALSSLGLPLSGKIKAGAEPGRAIARLTDLGYGNALRDLFRDETPDGPVPVPLVKAMLEVLGDWRPGVDGLVVVESATRPALVADLAGGLSRYLGAPVLGRYRIVDHDVRPGQGAMNSAQRVAALRRRFRLDAELPPDARVLLVDDLTVSGWTLTVAAHDLRAAGAAQVLPLVLAAQS
jgi:ATP-dependent DNA helicase RecQ